MKISLNWINDYVDLDGIDTDWLVNKFTITTAEIEEVHHMEDDVIIEIDNKSLTNRPDLWCHYGIAREISAIAGRKLRGVDYVNEEMLKQIDGRPLNVDILDRKKCLRYSAIKIGNVNITMSPEPVAARLTNCGIKPINIIVDMANYVMLDIGQPLHTFDEKYIDSIKVDSLKEPIKFVSLDGIERKLPKDTLMICSKDDPLAIAGIIGGEESAVSENTQGIVLESATFNGVAVRKTSSAIGIRTDASIRYEKFLDTSITTTAIGRFIWLLQQYQPDIKLEVPMYDNIVCPVKPINIAVEHKYIETYLGNEIDRKMVINILRNLEFEVEEKDNAYNIAVPTYRATKDITCKADIVEEILRIYGYDNIKGSPYKAAALCAEKNTMEEMEYMIKDILVKKFNFNEVHSYSWYDSNWLRRLGYEYDNALKIINSSVKQFEQLRCDITPNILEIIYNNRKNYEKISIFETGRVFLKENNGITQPKHLTAAVYSSMGEEEAYRYIKGVSSYLIGNIKNIEAEYIKTIVVNRENCLSINHKGAQIGSIYSIPASILKMFSSKHSICILDIDLELLNNIERNEIRYSPISKYPETYLDFSILTASDIPYCDIESLVDKFTHRLIVKTDYMDTYSGENVPANMKSTTIRLAIGDRERTLGDEEIDEVKRLFINYLYKNGLQIR